MRDDAGESGFFGIGLVGVQRVVVARQAAEIGDIRHGDLMRAGGIGPADLDVTHKTFSKY